MEHVRTATTKDQPRVAIPLPSVNPPSVVHHGGPHPVRTGGLWAVPQTWETDGSAHAVRVTIGTDLMPDGWRVVHVAHGTVKRAMVRAAMAATRAATRQDRADGVMGEIQACAAHRGLHGTSSVMIVTSMDRTASGTRNLNDNEMDMVDAACRRHGSRIWSEAEAMQVIQAQITALGRSARA